MHGGWQLFSLTLLVEVERSLLIKWVALYAHANVWMRKEREKHKSMLLCLAGRGVVRRGMGTRRACE
jgi:hypothetical protein